MQMPLQMLAERIIAYSKVLPEGTPLAAKTLLHLGTRAAVDQALSRLARRGRLLRAGRGFYLRPVESRYGVRAPAPEKVVEAIAARHGEVIATSGAAAANALGLTAQVPVRLVYWTSGRSRKLRLGAQTLELRHVPRWQLTLAHCAAGEAVRALAWIGPEKAAGALRQIAKRLPKPDLKKLVAARAQLPSWLAQLISKLLVEG